jgi:Family of unknown function (DUF6786)
LLLPFCMLVLLAACKDPGGSGSGAAADSGAAVSGVVRERPLGQFGYDLKWIGRFDRYRIVLQSGRSKVLVSAKFQGKVFSSCADGDSSSSFGWVHYDVFKKPADPHMNAYGGEDRLWLGPEGGRFSLFFAPGDKMEFANWHTPGAFDTAAWEVVNNTETSVDMRKDMQLVNYAGTHLNLSVDRQITILSRGAIDSLLGLSADTSVKAVAYRTVNTLTNTGAQAWTAATGMPCLWLLDMFPPSSKTTIIIPYAGGDSSKPATTDYFGEIPADRISFRDSVLRFTADGKSRGKLGIHPLRAKNVAGSYDSVHRVLTITLFDVDPHARYLNQEWTTTKPPFSGDAVNAYNDGPLAGGGQMGPFYELESVSPAAFLAPSRSQVHHHSVFHFTGSEAGLDKICRKVLGVGLR